MSECIVHEWTLEAVHWNDYYASQICYLGKMIETIGDDPESGATTRLDAQIRAEKLLKSWLLTQTTLIEGRRK